VQPLRRSVGGKDLEGSTRKDHDRRGKLSKGQWCAEQGQGKRGKGNMLLEGRSTEPGATMPAAAFLAGIKGGERWTLHIRKVRTWYIQAELQP